MSEPVTINVDGSSKSILCGICNQSVAFVGEGEGDTGNVGCVACGNITSTYEVARIASDYVESELQLRLNRVARDVASQTKIMTFSGDTEHNQVYRFTVDF